MLPMWDTEAGCGIRDITADGCVYVTALPSCTLLRERKRSEQEICITGCASWASALICIH